MLIVFDKIGFLQLQVFLSRNIINVEGFVLLQFHIYFFSPPDIKDMLSYFFDFINLH